MCGVIPPVEREVDATAERHGVVDDHDLLVMDGAGRMGAVNGEVDPFAADLIHQRYRGDPVPDPIKGRQQPQIGSQQVNVESRPFPQHPIQKGAQLVGSGECLGATLKRRPGVEIPSDQHDSVPGAQHRGFDVPEIIGPVDDAGELAGASHRPARLAGDQQSIVGHTALSVTRQRPYAVAARTSAWICSR